MNYNPYSLTDKIILITGASSGIGRTTAIESSKLGARCIITGRNVKRLQETYNQLEGDGHMQIIADLSTQEGIDALVSQTPQLDGVVNNAGIEFLKPIAFYKQKDLETMFQTNTFAPMLITKSLVKSRKINSSASIVFISSIAAHTAFFGSGIYGASKAAITSYMRYVAQELSTKKIRVNAVQPGMVDTPLIHNSEFSEEDMNADEQQYPLKRYGKPEDIAWTIIFLLSNASSWITAQVFNVDGGRTGIIA